jgi:hypothetical protein
MKAFSRLTPVFLPFSCALGMYTGLYIGSAQGASAYPTISSPFAQPRKAPVFPSELVPMAKTWGVAIPVGTPFQVEKVYGRWVFGKPLPLRFMKASDHSAPGWIFSRHLVVPGDADTLSPSQAQAARKVIFHARDALKKLGENSGPVDFLETLTLSRKTLDAFSKPEQEKAERSFSPLPFAYADEGQEKEPAPLGLTGTDLSFLDQEIQVIQDRKQVEAQQLEARKLKTPSPPALDDSTRAGVLGRYLLERYLDLPALSMEEVDGYIYMRATAMRALRGCPKEVQAYWKNRRWAHFRVFRLKSRPEIRHPWLEIALPGGYFALSGKAIEQAASEAELAFLLVRQLARELRVKRKALRFQAKNWPGSLPPLAEEVWDQVLKAQSTKDSENLDVADEIAVDMTAVECIAKAGYRPAAALAYLKKLALNKDQPWAEWFAKHSIGLDYRVERVAALTQESIAQRKIPDGSESQGKRFASASRQWNILP